MQIGQGYLAIKNQVFGVTLSILLKNNLHLVRPLMLLLSSSSMFSLLLSDVVGLVGLFKSPFMSPLQCGLSMIMQTDQFSYDLEIERTIMMKLSKGVMMVMMMVVEEVGEVFRRLSSLFNNLFMSFLKHSLAFTHNGDDEGDANNS